MLIRYGLNLPIAPPIEQVVWRRCSNLVVDELTVVVEHHVLKLVRRSVVGIGGVR